MAREDEHLALAAYLDSVHAPANPPGPQGEQISLDAFLAAAGAQPTVDGDAPDAKRRR